MDLPIGAIVLWDVASIPSGWQVCDGTNGTPDCLNRFAYASPNDSELGQTGGTSTHKHAPASATTGTEAAHGHSSLSGESGSPIGTDDAIISSVYLADASHTHLITITVTNGGEHAHNVNDTGYESHIPVHVNLVHIIRMS